MIPLLHDFSEATVLIFGGGPVGARKARRFDREADVVVVSPAFCDRSFGDAELIREAPEPAAVADWFDRFEPALAVAATDDEAVNAAVAAEANARGTLVNRADESGSREPGSVVVPATIREDPVVVAVATGGTAPALSKYLREDLEDRLAGAGEMATVCSTLRSELKDRDVPPTERRTIVTDVVNSSAAWTDLRTGTSNCEQVIEDVLAESTVGGRT